MVSRVNEYSLGDQWVISEWSVVAQIFENTEWSVGLMSMPWVISQSLSG